jgi:hypothetical protein
MRKDIWWAPLTGLAFIVLAAAAFVVSGEPPDIDEPVQKIVDFYVDNKDEQMVGAILEALAATLFVFFAGVLRRALRDAEGDRGILSAVAFAGAIIFATGLAFDATLTFALAETADDIDPAAVQALAALWQNDFVPFAVGLQLFLLGTGLSLVRHGALPKWIGWLAILVGLIAVTPIGFAAFFGTAILVLIMSVLMTMRARAADGTSAGAGAS